MKKQLIIILLTVLLDIIWLWIVIPILPFIVKAYWFSEFYVWLTFAIFSLGMFIWGLIFWKLSDRIGRNKTLELTIWLNIVWYLLFAFSSSLYVFLIARFIGGLWASWFAVWQAYISDISDNKNRTQNMAMIWAMFGIWFMIWPVFWGLLSWLWDTLNIVWYISAFIAFLNLLLVIFFLPKISKVYEIKEKIQALTYKTVSEASIILFIVSFIVALWFSAMQSSFALVLNDRFLVDARWVWYFFWFIWIIAIIYQWWLIRYVKKYLTEASMILFWLSFLIIWFVLFSINNYYLAIFFIIALFPIGYGTVNPTVASMQAKNSPSHVGKILWINASMISLWNIAWPFISGYLYMIWSWLPYIFSSILFIWVLILVLLKVKLNKI